MANNRYFATFIGVFCLGAAAQPVGVGVPIV
jgi:hypothetical protein